MNLLDLLKEYKENKIDEVGYKLSIKSAEIDDHLSKDERNTQINEFKRKIDMCIRKVDLVDKYDFKEVFTKSEIKVLKYIYIDGLAIKDIPDMNHISVRNKHLYQIRKKAENIKIVI